jgi:hypothetical protein
MFPTSGPVRVAAALSIAFGLVPALRAGERNVRLPWAELGPAVSGRKISTILSDGTSLSGKVIAIKPEAMVVHMGKTSDPGRFHGDAEVPRALVSALRVSKPGWKWRVILPLTCAVGFAAAGGAIGGRVDPGGFIISDGAANGIAVGLVTGAATGYVAGHFADKHTLIVEVVR